ncbi:efflux RND transporter permease subunit [Thermovenabulum gondwanense]|uniref:Swarming motility protein SwrC n=1 Tax=Thermovenabulum gondwanense TaxID=520767 RepID=A0A162MWV0_9FIRM|nr:efflux RND transporter permease subunit [Thermovenabulum gondwanense]KYO68047.1 Swarming motility protein SwrC [Thermovenabulum gondwanense]
MSFASFSIKRPVTMLMIILVILVLGFVSLTRLGIDLLPNFSFPIAVVVTEYSDAGPQEVENMVTKPLEQIIATVKNVKSISSISNEGYSTVIVQFNWGTNMDFATLDLREKIDMVKAYLPSGVKSPQIFKFDPSMLPVMEVAVYGMDDISQLKKYAEDEIKPKLLRAEGVASVDIVGGTEREIHIKVDPSKLIFYGITMDNIARALQMENLNLSGGSIAYGDRDYLVRVLSEFKSVSQIENLPITLPSGITIPLKDIARVEDTHKDIATISKYNGKPSITLVIQKQSDYNTVKVADKVQKELDNIKKSAGENLYFVPIFDQAEFIKKAINRVVGNAYSGALLAVLIIYLFLGNLRTTLIIGLSIPISIISTFILVYFNHLTLNMMSLGGLALGVGMLVDNSIVVLENIFRHRERGEDSIASAINGTNEVTNAIVASTLTTIAVFLPIVFIQGITAQLFKELALTVTFSLLASLAVAITLVPLLSSRLMIADKGKKITIIERFSVFYEKVEKRYRKLLAWALNNRKKVVATATVLFIVSLALIPLVGTEFLPQSDAGMINVSIEMPYGTRLEKVEETVNLVVDRIKNIKEIEGILTNVGVSGSGSGMGFSTTSKNEAQVSIKLVPLSERKRKSAQVADEIRSICRTIPGAKITVRSVSTFDFSGGNLLKPISIVIKGDDLNKLKEISDRVVTAVRSVEGTREVESSLDKGRPEIQIKVDKLKVAFYGLNSAQIAKIIESNLSGFTATKYKYQGEEINVVVKADEDVVSSIDKLENLIIPTPSGGLVTLSQIAEIKKENGPVAINREDQVRAVTVSGAISGRPVGVVNREIEEKLKTIPLPPGYEIKMGGEQEQLVEAFADLSFALILAVLLVYMVMAAQFESLFQPFIIMFSVPLAVIGVVLSLVLTGRNLNVPAFIGVIMLGGIVVNNAIVLIDFINQLRARGYSRTEAILEAGPMRLRPILMTTLTTILGLFPLALGLGEAGELRAPMATVVIGGLTVSTMLTLVVIPVVYTIFEDIGQRIRFFRKTD